MQPVSDVVATRGRGRGLWKKEGQQDISELRRPHTLATVAGSKSEIEQNTAGIVSAATTSPPPDPGARGDSFALPRTSRLSADAKEFVPKCYIVDQFEEAGGGDAYADSYPIPDHLSENFLSDVIHDLTLNPGHYHNSATVLTELLLRDVGDINLYQCIVNSIIEKSIIFPNFRYNGARLLCHFRDALPTDAQHDFRTVILRRCQEENVAVMRNSNQNPVQSQGFALFLAELYIQLSVTFGAVGRITILGAALFEVLKTLLSYETCENIKCVCQVLKLTGLALDEQDTRTMDAVFERLTEISDIYDKESTVRLILSVIKLRQNAWRPPSLLPSASAACVSESNDTSPFILPNGDTLSPEESRFLQDNIEQCEGCVENSEECPSNASIGGIDELEDDEFYEAFEAFLVFSKQAKSSS